MGVNMIITIVTKNEEIYRSFDLREAAAKIRGIRVLGGEIERINIKFEEQGELQDIETIFRSKTNVYQSI